MHVCAHFFLRLCYYNRRNPPNTLYSFCLKSLATPPGFSLYKNNEENPGFVRVGHSPDCGIFLVYLSKFRYNRDANSK